MEFDSVEMVMALEEGLGIEIADIDVEKSPNRRRLACRHLEKHVARRFDCAVS